MGHQPEAKADRDRQQRVHASHHPLGRPGATANVADALLDGSRLLRGSDERALDGSQPAIGKRELLTKELDLVVERADLVVERADPVVDLDLERVDLVVDLDIERVDLDLERVDARNNGGETVCEKRMPVQGPRRALRSLRVSLQ